MLDELTDDVSVPLGNELVKLIDRHGRIRKGDNAAAKGRKGNFDTPSPSCRLHDESIFTIGIAAGRKLMPMIGDDHLPLSVRVQIVFRHPCELANEVSEKKLVLEKLPRRFCIDEAGKLPLNIA